MTPAAAAPPAPFRVVVLGDSLAAGTGDETGKGIAGHLPALAPAGERPLVARSLGVRGATTADLRALLRQPRGRDAVGAADALILSIGANDLFRARPSQQELLRAPLRLADEILARIADAVDEIRGLNPRASLLLLGGYNPAPRHPLAPLVEPLVALWDARLARRFAADPAVAVVRIADLVDRPDRLSRLDGFHPGAEAYRETARRIAGMLRARSRAA